MEKYLEYHQFLNDIYIRCEKCLEYLHQLSYEATLNSYNHHYININGTYLKQEYYMPVITVENKGDICFNMGIIEFEFYISKEELVKSEILTLLINKYEESLSVYEFEDCTKDMYHFGDTKEVVLKRIKESKDLKFGIGINVSHLEYNEIVWHFNQVCQILKKDVLSK